jgi:hypothetical protein
VVAGGRGGAGEPLDSVHAFDGQPASQASQPASQPVKPSHAADRATPAAAAALISRCACALTPRPPLPTSCACHPSTRARRSRLIGAAVGAEQARAGQSCRICARHGWVRRWRAVRDSQSGADSQSHCDISDLSRLNAQVRGCDSTHVHDGCCACLPTVPAVNGVLYAVVSHTSRWALSCHNAECGAGGGGGGRPRAGRDLISRDVAWGAWLAGWLAGCRRRARREGSAIAMRAAGVPTEAGRRRAPSRSHARWSASTPPRQSECSPQHER